MTVVWDVYAKQLFQLGYGYPLWYPESDTGEVLIGDVGYLIEGAFRRILNATRPAGDSVNSKGVPQGYEMFIPKNKFSKMSRPGALAAGALYSQTIRQISAGIHASASALGGGLEFKCTDEQGAVLVIKESADRELSTSRRMGNYMRQNYGSWYVFGSKVLDSNIRKGDLMFICGTMKTTEWAVAAFTHHGQSAQVKFNGEFGAAASAAFSVSAASETMTTPQQNWGPRPKQSPDIPEQPGHQQQNQEDTQQDVHPSNKKNQCVFLNYYKLKVRLGLWPTLLKAAAGPHDLSPGPDDDSDGGQAGAYDDDSMTDDDVIERVPEMEKPYDPVGFLLDYILKYSNATVAIANDQDIVQLCKQHNSEIPADIPGFLETKRPHIEVTEDGVGMLSHEDIRADEPIVTTERDEPMASTEVDTPMASVELPDKATDYIDPPRSVTDDASHAQEGGNANFSYDTLLDKRKRLVDASTGSRADGSSLVLEGYSGGICALAYSPDGRFIASGYDDCELIIWEAETGRLKHRCTRHTDTVCSISFSPNGKELVSGSRDGLAIVWDVETGQPRTILEGHRGLIYSVAWSPDGRTIASGSFDFTIRIWDAASGMERSISDKHEGIVMLVAYSPDSTRLASASADNSARVWNVTNGQLVSTMEGHEGMVCSIAFSTDSRRVVTGSDDGTARIWHVESGNELVTLRGHAGSVWAVAFSPDGKLVLSAASDGTVRVHDSFGGDEVVSVDGGDGPVNSVAFSPDSTRICASAGNNSVHVWSTQTGTLLNTFTGHRGKVGHLLFSPDGRRIVSSSDDSTLRVWNL